MSDRPTGCYCSACNHPPCSWCESGNWLCPRCDSLRDKGEGCCDLYFDEDSDVIRWEDNNEPYDGSVRAAEPSTPREAPPVRKPVRPDWEAVAACSIPEALYDLETKYWSKIGQRTRRQQANMDKRLEVSETAFFELNGLGRSADVWDNRR